MLNEWLKYEVESLVMKIWMTNGLYLIWSAFENNDNDGDDNNNNKNDNNGDDAVHVFVGLEWQ